MTAAVVAMAYGTPPTRDLILDFYTDVRRGRPPTAEQLAELVGRYDAIGGVSPLVARTNEQIAALQRELDLLAPGGFVCSYGAKHAEPRIEQVIDAARAAGADRLVGLVLAPHYSVLSVGEYIERAAARAEELAMPAGFLERWGDEPALLDALADRVQKALAGLTAEQRAHVTVLFSAHSLPARILELGDPYPSELLATATAVAERCSLSDWGIAWQSAGRTPDPWLGPDITEVIDQLAAGGSTAVVVCPAGFTSDHLEILYDLDILAKERAAAAGIGFARTDSLNAEPAVFAALARRVIEIEASLNGSS